VSLDIDGIIAGLERRVVERRAASDYADLDWLDAEVEIGHDVLLDAGTPVDFYLQTPRATPPRARSTGGRASRARAAAARFTQPGLGQRNALDREVEDRLRDAVAWLRLSMHAEQCARENSVGIFSRDIGYLAGAIGELADEASQFRMATTEAMAEVQGAIADMGVRLRALEVDRSVQRAKEHSPVVPIHPNGAGSPPIGTAQQFDYLGFEDRFRGPEEQVTERLRHHLPRLTGQGPVLDLGCGRGELLRLLKDNGTEAWGVDSDAHMAEAARVRGVAVEHGDLFVALDACEPESLGAITSFHVIEHLSLNDQIRLIRMSRRALRPEGVLLLETPNPLSLVAGSINFLCDPTHVRPLHPDTLAFMMESEGFARTEIELLAPVPAEHRVPRVNASSETAEQVNAALDVIDKVLFGPQDIAVIGTR